MNAPWYLVSNNGNHPIALFEDKDLAEKFLADHAPDGSLSKIGISQCVIRPIVEVVNEHHPIVLGSQA